MKGNAKEDVCNLKPLMRLFEDSNPFSPVALKLLRATERSVRNRAGDKEVALQN